MILKTIRLQPFAGVKNREMVFNKGLNIVLGPNESGKSTMVNALKSILFVDTNLTASKNKSFLNSFLPADGGDTIHVSLEFFYKKDPYLLEKQWGATKSSKLTLSSGSIITSIDDIREKMQGILGLNQGTYENILIIRQSFLAETINSLSRDGQASESIQQILREASFATDGVSVSKLKVLINSKVEEYFSRWDRQLDRPEGMRDINNKWQKGASQGIIKAFYNFREAEKDYNDALEYELKLDEIIKKTEVLSIELSSLESYIANYKQVYNDIEKRKSLEYQRIIINNEISEIIEVSKAWPVVEYETKKIFDELTEVKKLLGKLEMDEGRAEKYESQKSLCERYLKVSRIFNEYNAEKEKLNSLQKITRQDIDELANARRTLDEFKAKFEALKLKVKLITKNDSMFKVGEGLDDIRDLDMKRGDSYEAFINGKFSLSTDSFELNVYSGESGYENISKKYEQAKKGYEALLLKHSAKDEIDLSKRAEIYKNQFNKTKLIGENLKVELGDQTYSNLEAQYKSIEHVEFQTSLNEIVKSISAEQIKLNNLERDFKEKRKLIEKWTEKYQSVDKLIELHSNNKNKLREIEEEINRSNSLPEIFSNADEFVKDYEAKNSLYETKKDEITNLKLRRAELEKYQPEFSTNELENKVNETLEEFNKVKKEGESYLLIKEELDNILAEIDSETFTPLKIEILNILKQLTLNKYSNAVIKEAIPTEIISDSGNIHVDLLSAGTKDILALAVRLGMANFYLEGRDGFIIMDDPLVNLDPSRQAAAVECIKRIGEQKQIILLTCHPSHARLFGIDSISLV